MMAFTGEGISRPVNPHFHVILHLIEPILFLLVIYVDSCISFFYTASEFSYV